ncbi:MAG: tripartite tricarboxylate transporter substrate binding protein [Betaproteobacteria bacterium]|nr:tripartite tricarboxylate transporter substrate binding protein [Betaproteobacteria bacterium]
MRYSLKALLAAWLSVGMAIVPQSTAAQGYPTRPIEVLVGYGPGGGSDLTIRLTEGAAARILGQKIVITNRPGAGGTVMMNQFMRAAPDGYTLAIGSTATLTVQPHVASATVLFKPEDYVPIVQISNIPNLLIVAPDSQFKTTAEFIDFARKNPPGRLKIGITSPGTTLHLPFVQMEKLYAVKFTFIPHKSSDPVVTAVMGAQIDAGGADLAAVGPKIQGGAVRALGLFAAKRLASLPNVPTLKEQGVDIEAGFYNMLLAPKGTPEAIIAAVHLAFRKALEDPDVIDKTAKANLPLEYLGPKESRARLTHNYEVFGVLLNDLGLKK